VSGWRQKGAVARLTGRRWLWQSKEGDNPEDGPRWAETPLGHGSAPERKGHGPKGVGQINNGLQEMASKLNQNF
jgi:hypothetical protein